jgi:glycosyltransferase involved in cell wall biosynthesis
MVLLENHESHRVFLFLKCSARCKCLRYYPNVLKNGVYGTAVFVSDRKIFGARKNITMTDLKPLVSICMSTYSRPDLFAESLAGLLRQTYNPLELLVLVDGAEPQTIRILESVKDKRLRWFSTPHASGMVRAWNTVVKESRGKYFLFCADDDVLQENAVDDQVRLMEQFQNIGFCHGDWKNIDDSGAIIGEWRSHEGEFVKNGKDEWRRYLRRTGCCMQTVVVRRVLWDKVNGWDEGSGNPGDNSLYLKLLRVGDVGHVARYVCHYRIRTKRPDSWDKKVKNIQEFYLLSMRHIDSAGVSVTEAAALVRALNSHLAWSTISLFNSAPDIERRSQFTAWASGTIWMGSLRGSIVKFLAIMHISRIGVAVYLLIHSFRQFAKKVYSLRKY